MLALYKYIFHSSFSQHKRLSWRFSESLLSFVSLVSLCCTSDQLCQLSVSPPLYLPCCTVFCVAVQNQPLTYEVSYSSQGSERSRLIYRGLNNTVVFKLPAGDPATNYSGKTLTSLLYCTHYAYYHLRALQHIRHLLPFSTAQTLACSLIMSRLDYCSTGNGDSICSSA